MLGGCELRDMAVATGDGGLGIESTLVLSEAASDTASSSADMCRRDMARGEKAALCLYRQG